MLSLVISQYLESHKRLVVPQLGAFIVKEPGHAVLFSELLKRDDGVLRRLLSERGMNELEAAGEIDRFVFEVRHAAEHGGEYPLPGFGVLAAGPNGTVAFRYDPAPVSGTASPESPAAETVGKETPVGAAAAADGSGEAPAAPVRTPRVRPGRLTEAVKQAFDEPHVSPSAKLNPDPSVRGLRYGRPPKNTDAYTYVGRVPRRRTDRFIWIAVIAAVLALAAIGYGYYRDYRERQIEAEWAAPAVPDEPQSDAAAAGETGVSDAVPVPASASAV